MLIDYDLWSDVPWKPIGPFDLRKPVWVRGNRTIPFWWPVGVPLFAPASRHWVILLAAANFLALLWFGLRLMRLLRNYNPARVPVSTRPFSVELGCQKNDQ
jgi:hypothetical protein